MTHYIQNYHLAKEDLDGIVHQNDHFIEWEKQHLTEKNTFFPKDWRRLSKIDFEKACLNLVRPILKPTASINNVNMKRFHLLFGFLKSAYFYPYLMHYKLDELIVYNVIYNRKVTNLDIILLATHMMPHFTVLKNRNVQDWFVQKYFRRPIKRKDCKPLHPVFDSNLMFQKFRREGTPPQDLYFRAVHGLVRIMMNPIENSNVTGMLLPSQAFGVLHDIIPDESILIELIMNQKQVNPLKWLISSNLSMKFAANHMIRTFHDPSQTSLYYKKYSEYGYYVHFKEIVELCLNHLSKVKHPLDKEPNRKQLVKNDFINECKHALVNLTNMCQAFTIEVIQAGGWKLISEMFHHNWSRELQSQTLRLCEQLCVGILNCKKKQKVNVEKLLKTPFQMSILDMVAPFTNLEQYNIGDCTCAHRIFATVLSINKYNAQKDIDVIHSHYLFQNGLNILLCDMKPWNEKKLELIRAVSSSFRLSIQYSRDRSDDALYSSILQRIASLLNQLKDHERDSVGMTPTLDKEDKKAYRRLIHCTNAAVIRMIEFLCSNYYKLETLFAANHTLPNILISFAKKFAFQRGVPTICNESGKVALESLAKGLQVSSEYVTVPLNPKKHTSFSAIPASVLQRHDMKEDRLKSSRSRATERPPSRSTSKLIEISNSDSTNTLFFFPEVREKRHRIFDRAKTVDKYRDMLNQLQTSKERGSFAFESVPGSKRPQSAVLKKNSRRDYTPKRPSSAVQTNILSPAIVSMNSNTVDSIRTSRPKSAYEVKSARLRAFGKIIEKAPSTPPKLRRPNSSSKRKAVREECVYCGDATFRSVHFCPTCRRLPYCSEACQKMHWDRIHHMECSENIKTKIFSPQFSLK